MGGYTAGEEEEGEGMGGTGRTTLMMQAGQSRVSCLWWSKTARMLLLYILGREEEEEEEGRFIQS